MHILVLILPWACPSVGTTMGKGGALCTLTSEIAIFRRNSQHCRGSDVSGAGSVVFYRQLWGPWRGGPKTATLSRIPAPTPPDPERQGHLYFEASPFACGSAMIFFRCRYLRHFRGATFEFSQHCRESGVSLRKKVQCFIVPLVTRAGRLLNTIEDPGTYPARSREAGPSLFRSGPVCVR